MNMESHFSNFHDWCSMFFCWGGVLVYLNMVTFRGRGKDSILGSKTAVYFWDVGVPPTAPLRTGALLEQETS